MWFFLLLVLPFGAQPADPGESEWVHLPSKCEVCKYVAVELKSSFDETSRTGEVIETRYDFLDEDKRKKKIKYTKSYIRLIEVMESICPRLLEYNLHKERTGSNRFAKGMSETFQTLHHLVHKGVKVVMDIPYELWNETSAEVADMKKQCDVLLEEYEDVIEDWYHNHQQEDLTEFLCAGHVLGEQDRGCLYEEWSSKKGDNAPSKGNKKQNKGKERKKSRKETVQTKEELNVQKSQGSQDKDVTRNKASRDQDVRDGQASREPVTPESQASEGQDIPKSHAPREKTPHTRANEEL